MNAAVIPLERRTQILTAALALAAVATAPAPGSGQDRAAEPLEEVVVTGSRIARASDFESPNPVITIDRESLERSGYSNLQQFFEKLPTNGAGALV